MTWTKRETDLLTKLWPTRAKIYRRFSCRSQTAVRNKAARMGLGKRDKEHAQVRTPERIQLARAMRAEGKAYRDIATSFGLSCGSIIRQWIDPEYNAKRKEEARMRRASIPKSPVKSVSQESVERAAAQLAKLIPEDTRDLTARLCGDPLPGRRAIDFKREMQPRQGEVPFQ